MPAAHALRRQPDLTRQRLLDSAFSEIYRSGFRGASLDAILQNAGVTKGALYHHFESKTALGHAVIEEVIRPWIEEGWKPLIGAEDVIDTALGLCARLLESRTAQAIECGCPLNNLISELAPVDEDFRVRLQGILDDWRRGLAGALRQGQARGTVRRDIEASAAADFIISCIEGSVSLAKAKHSRRFLESSTRGLVDYLEQLRPRG